jgi:uncharacterized protein YbcV (DUF1398 family)
VDGKITREGVRNIESLPEKDKTKLYVLAKKRAEELLASPDGSVAINGMWMIRNLPEENRAKLLERALAHADCRVAREGARMIRHVTEKERPILYNLAKKRAEEFLANPDGNVAIEGTRIIQGIPPHKCSKLIERALDHPDSRIADIVTGMISRESEQDRNRLYNLAKKKAEDLLANSDGSIAINGVKMIDSLPEQEQAKLIEIALAHPDGSVASEGAKMITQVPEQERAPLFDLEKKRAEELLASPDGSIAINGVKMIDFLPEMEWTKLIEIALAHPDGNVAVEGAGLLEGAPAKDIDRLYNLAKKRAQKLLANLDGSIAINGVKMIESFPQLEQEGLIEIALVHPDRNVAIMGAEMIKNVPWLERAKLSNLILKRSDIKEIIDSPLYEKSPELNTESFARKNFEKTGSETILIGGSLKEKIIIRKISPVSFLAWQKAYESYEQWKSAGFDYVPIEPIQSFRFEKSGMVSVASGVLDLSLKQWIRRSGGVFKQELENKKYRIISTLKTLKIRHGHNHDENFILRFFRHADGEPDVSKCPRLYLIDFDQSRS